MKNVKDQICAALVRAFGESAVTDTYPTNWASLPAVQYTEEENRVHGAVGEGEVNSYVRYRVDIWDPRSTSTAALKVDQVLGAVLEEYWLDGIPPLGLVRTSCSDTPDPSGLKHKVMRFEGIISMKNDFVEWPG